MSNDRTMGLCTLAIVAAIGSATSPGTVAGVVMYLSACALCAVVVVFGRFRF